MGFIELILIPKIHKKFYQTKKYIYNCIKFIFMKAILRVSILFLSLYLIGCSSDDNENSNNFESYVSFNNNRKELDKGYITANDHYIELYLMSPNVDINQNGGTTGSGSVVSLFFYSPEATSLPADTYSVSSETMDRAVFIDNSETPPIIVSTENVTVDVTSGGLENLTLTFDIVNAQGEHFEGKWTGDLTVSN